MPFDGFKDIGMGPARFRRSHCHSSRSRAMKQLDIPIAPGDKFTQLGQRGVPQCVVEPAGLNPAPVFLRRK